VQSITKLT